MIVGTQTYTSLTTKYRAVDRFEVNGYSSFIVSDKDHLVNKPHFHLNENGVLVKCYHGTKTLLTDYAFWIGVTISFPLEHFLWTKVPGFSHLAVWLGLIKDVH